MMNLFSKKNTALESNLWGYIHVMNRIKNGKRQQHCPIIYQWSSFLFFGVYYSMKWCLFVLIFLFHVKRTIAVLLIPRSCWPPLPRPTAFSAVINYTHSAESQAGTKIMVGNCFSQELAVLLLFCNIDIVSSAKRIVTSDVPSWSNGIIDTWYNNFRAKADLRIYLIKSPNSTDEEIEVQRGNMDTPEFKPLSY